MGYFEFDSSNSSAHLIGGVVFWLGYLGMKSLLCAVLIACTLPVTTSANDIDGKWKAWFVGAMTNRPKLVSETVFELKAEGNSVTGTADMGGWLSTSVRKYDDVFYGDWGESSLIGLASGGAISDAEEKPFHRNLI